VLPALSSWDQHSSPTREPLLRQIPPLIFRIPQRGNAFLNINPSIYYSKNGMFLTCTLKKKNRRSHLACRRRCHVAARKEHLKERPVMNSNCWREIERCLWWLMRWLCSSRCVRVCVGHDWGREGRGVEREKMFVQEYISVHADMRYSLCVCVCVHARLLKSHIRTHTHTHAQSSREYPDARARIRKREKACCPPLFLHLPVKLAIFLCG